jgi:glucan 1,3-beta-glucosidase
MYGLSKLALAAAFLVSPLVGAIPTSLQSRQSSASSYWLSSIQRQGTVAFGSDNSSSYTIFRNVQTYGAKGDGTTDDTDAINSAIADQNRCGQGCDSSTITPAIIYFPPGTYLVSKPIVQYYYTQFIGDAVNIPTIKAAPSFTGMAVIDSDPYLDTGANWYTNQNNFFRQVRNFVIDLTAMPKTAGAGIHWQVAQATSLQNIVFNMIEGEDSNQQGIFMDNGSGGFMTDLVFNGGNYGAFFGNQQFTTRNLTFNNVNTAIFMNWNWLWTLKSINVNNCGVGVNMSTGGSTSQTVGSVLIQDSTFKTTKAAVVTAFTKGQANSNGTLIIDNSDFTGSTNAVTDLSGNVILAGGSKVASWGQGHAYTTGSAANVTRRGTDNQIPIQGSLTAPAKPTALVNANGAIFERAKPQYESVPVANFVSVKSAGAKGDGVTDDTAAIQKVLDSATADQVVYFDHGAYRVTDTVKIPKNIKITGEIWPLLMADGPSFSDSSNPKPVFQVGQPGDVGNVEISDLIFETLGPAPGAIIMEWNVAEESQGSAGLWDTHFRIGGTAGTQLQSDKCAMTPNSTQTVNNECVGAYLLFHITSKATAYLENNWFWVSDHELDLADHNQVNIFNGRGVLIESAQGPVWAYGTSSEHSQLYNYQLNGASNIYMGAIQTETPYYQPTPVALQPFAPTTGDPTFDNCTDDTCKMAWGLRIVDSSNILIYGAGHYSFFNDYSQDCLATESCQDNIVSIENCTGEVYLWGLSTKASTNIVTVDGNPVVPASSNGNTFCQSIALFESA